MGAKLGDRVREAREAADLSQEQLAKKVGIKQPTIAAIESGKIKETAHIVKIAVATRHSAVWLDTGKGPKLMSVVELLALSDNEQAAVQAFIEALRKNRGK